MEAFFLQCNKYWLLLIWLGMDHLHRQHRQILRQQAVATQILGNKVRILGQQRDRQQQHGDVNVPILLRAVRRSLHRSLGRDAAT